LLQKESIHFARGHTKVSCEDRGGWSMSRDGVCVPILALKSPQTMVVSWGCTWSSTSSSWAVACYSVMLRRAREDVGGRYTFIIFTRWLFGRTSFMCRQYSLPVWLSTCRAFRMYVARPPLAPVERRCSRRVNPFIMGGGACSAIHVSWRHRTSNSS
jgi:hypothetical protein